MITKFDRSSLKTLRTEIDAALAEVAKRNGITLMLGNIRFQDNTFNAKVTGDTATSKSAPKDGENSSELKWRKGLNSFAATTLGFTQDMAGKTFRLYGEQYVLIGFRPKAKAKVVARKPGHKSYTALPHQPVIAELTA